MLDLHSISSGYSELLLLVALGGAIHSSLGEIDQIHRFANIELLWKNSKIILLPIIYTSIQIPHHEFHLLVLDGK